MRKIMCDRCGKDIGNAFIRHKFEIIGFEGYSDYDLCSNCIKELMKWIKGDKR